MRKLSYKVTWKIKFKCPICLSCLSCFDLDVLVFLYVLTPMMTMKTMLTMTTMYLSASIWRQKSEHTSQIRFYLLQWYRNWKLAISHHWKASHGLENQPWLVNFWYMRYVTTLLFWLFNVNEFAMASDMFWFWGLVYETVADVPESWVRWRADFQSGSRVLKKVFWTFL